MLTTMSRGLLTAEVKMYITNNVGVTSFVSRAGADHRAGTAGRTRTGVYYRMDTKETYIHLCLRYSGPMYGGSSAPETECRGCLLIRFLWRSFFWADQEGAIPSLSPGCSWLQGSLTSFRNIMGELKLDPTLAKDGSRVHKK